MIERSTLKSFKQGVARGLGIGIGISIALATTTLFAAAAAMKVFSAGEVISAAELNRNFTMAAPEGEVSAFYLSDCPEGWTIADGTNGTPDLRGRFIRGMDNMGVGAANVDPQSAIRTLGHEQMDAFQGHRHSPLGGSFWGHTAPGSYGPASGAYYWGSSSKTGDPTADASGIAPRTSTETRPRNVALIYCMRQN
ncbi:phage tail protein [Leptonema illini]|nr:phage tail protein [Leptonema illini]